jgi:exopolysaccharide production protein ExoY
MTDTSTFGGDAVEATFSEVDLAMTRSGSNFWGRAFYRHYFKRAFDVVAVLAVAPFVLPVLAILGFLIRRDGGPAFYKQERVGKGGRIFHLWKLRSMVVDADSELEAYLAENPIARREWDQNQKLFKDPRVTAVGRLIRKSSLDELPQLWNILKGDMSLVGPRPMMPSQQRLYAGRAYYALRPGLTGIWQTRARNQSSFASRARYDREYDRRLSFLTDLGLIRNTVFVVLRGTGQ